MGGAHAAAGSDGNVAAWLVLVNLVVRFVVAVLDAVAKALGKRVS